MVEAAVSCPAQPDDIDPPPYRPVEISEQSASRPNENRTSTLNPPTDQKTRRMEGIEEGDIAASRPDTDAPVGITLPRDRLREEQQVLNAGQS